MTLYEILENENIRSDRYAMAAISCIFKAFGDPIRSKEYWPWGRDVQCEWTPSKGTELDITNAELLLERARIKFDEEQKSASTNNYTKIYESTMDNTDKQIKALKKRLSKLQKSLKDTNIANENIIKVSEDVDSKIS